MAATDERDGSLESALAAMADAIDGETVTLREVLDGLGEQGLLMICALLSLPFLLPVSVPGLSTAFGLAILLLSVSLVMGGRPRLPRFVLDRPSGRRDPALVQPDIVLVDDAFDRDALLKALLKHPAASAR